MRVLLDKNVPYEIRQFLPEETKEPEYTVKASERLGWKDKSDADLLKAAQDAGFNVLVTADQNLPYQQNLAKSKLGTVVLGSAEWPIIQNFGTQIASAVNAVQPGNVIKIDMPNPRKESRDQIENEVRAFLKGDKKTVDGAKINVLDATKGDKVKGPVIALTNLHVAVRKDSAPNTVYIFPHGQVIQSLGHKPALGENVDFSIDSRGALTAKPVSKGRGTGR